MTEPEITTVLADQTLGADAIEPARKRIVGEIVPRLAKLIPGFEALPLAAKRACIDVAWSTGWSAHGFYFAVGKRDWTRAIAESGSAGNSQLRRAWIVGLLESCKRSARQEALKGFGA